MLIYVISPTPSIMDTLFIRPRPCWPRFEASKWVKQPPATSGHRATKNVSDVGADVGQSCPIMVFQVSFWGSFFAILLGL